MTDVFSLHGKTVLVTGGSSGIGAGIAKECADAGATVIVTGRSQEKLDNVIAALTGSGHTAITADLNQPESLTELAAALPKLDGLVHSAGLSKLMPLKWSSNDFFDEIAGINFRAPITLTRDVLAKNKLNKGGSIVFVSSTAAIDGQAGLTVYAGAKAAILGSVQVIAKEVAKSRIRVNAILPGLIATPMFLNDPDISEDAIEKQRAQYPWGFGQPADVAHACRYFLSDASKWVTGTSLVVDGGVTA